MAWLTIACEADVDGSDANADANAGADADADASVSILSDEALLIWSVCCCEDGKVKGREAERRKVEWRLDTAGTHLT